jgi:6-phosphogluconolactonase
MCNGELIQRHYYNSLKDLAADFADFSAAVLRQSLEKNQKISVVVPGGNTPRYYLPALGRQSLRWQDVTITLSDERWVDINAESSNERLVKENFISHMPETACFVGLKTPHDNPAQAVETIHQRLAQLPRPFSLTVLGLGEDGHIASLFPGMNPELDATPQMCLAVGQPIAPSLRISLTMNALTHSQTIILVVTGSAKRQLLDRLIDGPPDLSVPFVRLWQQSKCPIIIFETDAVSIP